MLEEKNAYVVDVRDLNSGGSEGGLQRELHGLLAAPDDQMPRTRMMVTLGFLQDQPSLSEIAPCHLPARHSSMTSPGLKSRFNTQYRVCPRTLRSAPNRFNEARRRVRTDWKNPPRS